MHHSDRELRRFYAHFNTTHAGWIDVSWRLVRETDDKRITELDSHPIASPGLESPEVWGGRFWLSAVFPPFTEMLAFLQLIAFGEDDCEWEFNSEGEGPSITWKSERFHIQYSDLSYETPVSGPQVASALYGAFREFATSARYKPEEWERHWNGEPLHAMRVPVLDRFLESDSAPPV